MWPFALSGRLCIVALVGRYLTNWLMHRRSIHVQGRGPFNISKMPSICLSGFSSRFQPLSRVHGQVTYVLLTRSPLIRKMQAPSFSVRLACIRHAASVHPEPGSNSLKNVSCRRKPSKSKIRKAYLALTIADRNCHVLSVFQIQRNFQG